MASKLKNNTGKAGKRQEKRPRNGKALRVLVLLLVLIASGVIGIYGYAIYGYHSIYPNVFIGSSGVSGLSQQQAEQTVQGSIDSENEDAELEVDIDGYTMRISSTDLNINISPSSTAKAAYEYGRTGNILKRISEITYAVLFGYNVEDGFFLDEDYIKQRVRQVAAEVDQEKSETTYIVEDTGIRVLAGQAGITLDVEALTALIVARIQAMDYSVLEFTPEKDDPAPLDLQAIYDQIHTEARDAYYSEELEVVPEAVGKSFAISEAELIIGQAPGQEVFIPFILTEPEITARYLEEALFRDTLSSTYTILTNPGLINRTSNVKLAAQFVNGTVLMPDEVFSYNEVVGERTEARGFKEAKVFVKNEIVDGIGGGICQISSTLYKASLYANLQIVERTNHSFTVDYTNLGEDATVYYGAVDYKFKNDTAFPVKIKCWVESPYVYVTIMGTREEPVTVEMDRITIDYIPYETVTQVDNTLAPGITKTEVYGHSGYKVETYRVVYGADGKEISRTFEARSVYKKLDELILTGPALTPSPSPSASDGVSPSPSESTSPSPSDPLSPSPSGSPQSSPDASPSPSVSDLTSPSPSVFPSA